MRGKLARLFALLTLAFLAIGLSLPWFMWERDHSPYIRSDGKVLGDRNLCWIDGTCRNEDFIFKGGFRAQRFFDAALMLIVISSILLFLPMLHFIWALHNKYNTWSGALLRTLIAILGILTFLSWVGAVTVFAMGVRNKYQICNFVLDDPARGYECNAGWNGNDDDGDVTHSVYGSRNRDIITFDANGTIFNTRSVHVEWGLNAGWYMLVMAAALLIPTIIFGLIMKNHRRKHEKPVQVTKVVEKPVVLPVPVIDRTVPAPVPVQQTTYERTVYDRNPQTGRAEYVSTTQTAPTFGTTSTQRIY